MPISNRLPRIVATIVFILIQQALQAQFDSSQFIISKKMYSVEDGLASREVFCGLQDDDGFMWFGTRNGLNRFDGKHFKLFSKQKNGLAENRIFQLAKDNQHHLFIVYENPAYSRSVMKIEVMDLKTHKVSSLKETFPNLPFDENYVYWVSNADNNIAFLISKPFQYWQLTNGKFKLKVEMKAWDNKASNPNDLLTAHGSYHTTTGMHCLFTNKDALLFLSNNLPFYFLSQDSLLTLNHFEEQGIITVAPEHKLLFHNATNAGYIHANGFYENHISTYQPPIQKASYEIFYRYLNHLNLLAYTSTDGLYLYDFKQWYKLLSPGELKISGGNALYGGYIDNQNNYWIFSSNGLAKIRVVRNPFTYYFTKAQLQVEGNNQARGIFSDGNKVYANIWDRFYWKTDYTVYKAIADKEILYGVCRHNNKIYTGTQSLHELDEKRHTISNQIVREESGDFWAMDSLSPEQLIVGTSKDIRIFYPKTKASQTVAYSSPDIPKVNFVYRFLRGKDKNIWAVAHNGLYKMDEHANRILDYWGKEGLPPGNNTKARVHQFPFQTIFDAYEDPEGIWWFATCSDGLFRWNRTENSFQQFTSAYGLPSDILYRIESDAYGNLWISTDNGLVRFNTKNYKTNTYNTTNGISHNEFNRASSFKDKDGRLFFGGLDGINAFYPSHFVHDSSVEAAPLRIITLNKFSEKENKLLDQTNEILLKNKIILQPGDRFFNLEFQLLDYIDGNLNYAYKIEGVDKDWNYINENSIRVSGLPYGNFILHIKGQAHNGQWSTMELQIPIEVRKPFYLHWWFILTLIGLLFLSIYLYLRWRTKQLLKSKQRLQETVDARTIELKESLEEKNVLLKEIHHRVKNNLQVISGLLELQEKNLIDEMAKQALREGRNRVRSMALIHQNLYEFENLSRIELRSFITDLYNQVCAMYETQAKNTQVNFEIPIVEIDLDTAVPFGLVLNELFTNLFKYAVSTDKLCGLSLTLEQYEQGSGQGRKFKFVYSDNGPGLPEGFDVKKSKSLGMRLIKDLSKQMGGTMQYEFSEGSTFTILFYDKQARKNND